MTLLEGDELSGFFGNNIEVVPDQTHPVAKLPSELVVGGVNAPLPDRRII